MASALGVAHAVGVDGRSPHTPGGRHRLRTALQTPVARPRCLWPSLVWPVPVSGRLLPLSRVHPGSSASLRGPTARFFPALGSAPLSGWAGVGVPSPTEGRLGDNCE